jgi:uroporphyrinogen decarboxylase
MLAIKEKYMNNRERAMNLLHFKSVDRLPAVHFGYWREVLIEWAEQGKISMELAQSVHDGNKSDRELDKIIGWDFDWYTTKSSRNSLMPGFERKVLETFADGTQRVLTGTGTIERIKPGIVSIASEDDYTLKDRAAFEELYKPKMQFSPDRIDVEAFKKFNETLTDKNFEKKSSFLDKISKMFK